jgi:hypothetical protein
MNNSSPEPNHRGSKLPVDKSGGHISYQPTPPHPCTPPDAALYPVRTRWTCDTCRDHWEVSSDGGDHSHYWRRGLPYPGWDDEEHQGIGRHAVVLLLLVVLIAAGLAIILSSG